MRATSPSRTIRVFSSANRSSIENRATFVWSLYLLRRVNGPQGEFLGMVLASMLLNAIADLYQSITLPSGQSIVLLRRDGTMLSRNLSPGDQVGTKMPATSGWYSLVARGGGHYESPGFFDTITRMVPYDRCPITRWSSMWACPRMRRSHTGDGRRG
jgi:hypothetical protein